MPKEQKFYQKPFTPCVIRRRENMILTTILVSNIIETR